MRKPNIQEFADNRLREIEYEAAELRDQIRRAGRGLQGLAEGEDIEDLINFGGMWMDKVHDSIRRLDKLEDEKAVYAQVLAAA